MNNQFTACVFYCMTVKTGRFVPTYMLFSWPYLPLLNYSFYFFNFLVKHTNPPAKGICQLAKIIWIQKMEQKLNIPIYTKTNNNSI